MVAGHPQTVDPDMEKLTQRQLNWVKDRREEINLLEEEYPDRINL